MERVSAEKRLPRPESGRGLRKIIPLRLIVSVRGTQGATAAVAASPTSSPPGLGPSAQEWEGRLRLSLRPKAGAVEVPLGGGPMVPGSWEHPK